MKKIVCIYVFDNVSLCSQGNSHISLQFQFLVGNFHFDMDR